MNLTPEKLGDLIRRYRGRGLLLDANVLIPYLAGLYDPGWFDRKKKLGSFSVDHALLVRWMVDEVGGFVTTVPALTEVTNTLDDKRFLAWLAVRLGRFKDLHRPARLIVEQTGPGFLLGLADASIIAFSGRYLPVTTDKKLVFALDRAGIEHLYFDLLWAKVTWAKMELDERIGGLQGDPYPPALLGPA